MSGYIGNIPVPQATQTRQSFTATASQTTFNTAGYSPGYIDVFLNGVKLAPADYTATNGSDVVLAVGAASGDILETVAYEIFQVLDQDFTGDFTVDGSTFVVDSTNDRVGIGTSSPSDKLHVNGNGKFNNIAFGGYLSPYGDDTYINMLGSGRIQFRTNGSEAMRIDSSGNVGIGSTTPNAKITLKRSGAGLLANGDDGTVVALIADTTGSVLTYGTYTSHPVTFKTANGERMRIDSSGNVGIGTTSPSSYASTTLEISGSSTTSDLKMTNTTTGTGNTAGYDLELNGNDINYVNRTASGNQKFWTNSTERMRIDSSGNLLVDTTSTSIVGSGGFAAKPQGSGVRLDISNSGGAAMLLDRRTNDGDIISFYKDGTTVGSIGNASSGFYINGSSTTSGLEFATNTIVPSKNTARIDAALNLGMSTNRFKDLYLSGGVYLGGVGSSNKLDDYEEGTWDPAWGGDSDPTVSYTNQNGWYVKVGNLVWCGGTIHTSSASGGSGNLLIRGLPFYSASDQANELSTMCVGYANNFGTNYPTAGYMGRNRTFVNVTSVDRSTGTALMQTSYLTNTSYMNFNITYTTD